MFLSAPSVLLLISADNNRTDLKYSVLFDYKDNNKLYLFCLP